MVDNEAWRGEMFREIAPGVHVTSQGLLSIKLNSDIRVDMTLDQGIRIINLAKGMIVAMNNHGTSSAMIHPSGRVYQYGSRIEVATSEARGKSKFAKIWQKGVSFTSEQCSLVYLVDAAGTRTSTDKFSDTNGDFSVPVFLEGANYCWPTVGDWCKVLENMIHWHAQDGSENWLIGGFRISLTEDGFVRAMREDGKFILRISSLNHSSSLTTPFVHATSSVCNGQDTHIFVKRGDKRIHYNGTTFVVRNSSHSAGFDDQGQLRVY